MSGSAVSTRKRMEPHQLRHQLCRLVREAQPFAFPHVIDDVLDAFRRGLKSVGMLVVEINGHNGEVREDDVVHGRIPDHDPESGSTSCKAFPLKSLAGHIPPAYRRVGEGRAAAKANMTKADNRHTGRSSSKPQQEQHRGPPPSHH